MTAVLPQPGKFYLDQNGRLVIDLGCQYDDLSAQRGNHCYTDAHVVDPSESAPIKNFYWKLRRANRRQRIPSGFMMHVIYRHPDTGTTWIMIRRGPAWSTEQLQAIWDVAVA